ncbi:MAG TPA: hypothetical protein VFN78_00300 [Ktedonobacterales bacterium]|nr:hypothetical protein [Ktedonobacterales bacterium]
MWVETAAAVVINGISLGSASGIPCQNNNTTPYQRVRLDARLSADSAVSVARRIAFGKRLAASLPAPTPDGQVMALAALYTVVPGPIGAMRTRTSAYLRWGISSPVVDATRDADVSHQRLGQQLCAARRMLDTDFTVETIGDDLDALFQENAAAPMVELAYTTWPQTSDWLAPAHVQPVIDLLAAQPDFGALQITLERVTDPAAPSATHLRLGIVALGAATQRGALRLLARELRGRGSLVAPSWRPSEAAPRLRVMYARTADERARIQDIISGPAIDPWAPIAQPGDIMLTSDEAGLLLPLPFALFAESEQ